MFWNWTPRFDRIDRALDTVSKSLNAIYSQGAKIMAQLSQDFLDLAKKIDTATNSVAARIDKISQGLKNSMTDQEVSDTKAALQAEVDRLTTLGQDPQNPVP